MALLDKLLSVVAPHQCVVCGEEGGLLCAWCKPDACLPIPEICYRCHALSADGAVCSKCLSATPLRYVKVHTGYDGAARQLLGLLKFERVRAAVPVIAELTRESLPYLDKNVIITHIPAATSRVRSRGYDQSRLVAGTMAKNSGLRHATLLARLGQSRQVGASREKRFEQMKNAFRPVSRFLIKGADIMLVDDVLTTGATLEEAARTLKRAGARRVNAIVFAHKR